MTKSKYQVDKGVDLPLARGRGDLTYPWDDTVLGDSFFVKAEKIDGRIQIKRLQARLIHAALDWLRSSGRGDVRVTTRQVDGGVRVWLVRRKLGDM